MEGRLLLGLSGLFRHLRSLDSVLDVLFLLLALLRVAPPHGSLVITSKSQVRASLACRLTFLALLSS